MTAHLLRAAAPFALALLCLSAFGCSDNTPPGDGDQEPEPLLNPDPDPSQEADQNPDPNPAPPLNPDPNPAPPMNPDPNPEPMTECGNGECEDGEDGQSCPDDCFEPECDDSFEANCINERALQVCEEGRLVTQACDVGRVCLEDDCLEVVCRPGDVQGCASQTDILICNDTGTGSTEQACEEGFFCGFVAGEFACTNQICTPNESRCRGLIGTEVCNEEGTAWVVGEDCIDGTQCDDSECKSLCEINSKVSSFLGCEYWSADLDNITGGTNAAHAVIISNPHPQLNAEITVTDGLGNPVYVTGWPTEVAPGTLEIWRFDNSAINSLNNLDLIDTARIDGTIIEDQTFKFESNLPVTAHQFNPLVENNVFTNDASLLLPTNAIGSEYLVMSWKHRGSGFELHGNFTIIAVGQEPTTVTVTPTASVNAGTDNINNTPIGRIPVGETREFVLMPGQILNLETEGPVGADLTGTEIITSQPAVVFGGHECANVPLGVDACDHIEQQLYPVNSWGSRYIGTHFAARNNPTQVEVWRILSGQDGVILTTVPSIPNVDGLTLNRGEFVEFETRTDFVLEATGPVLPGQYITGTSYNGNGTGDPALTLLVPIEQWRRDYIVLTPPAYNNGDYLNVAALTGTQVILDGVPIDPNLFIALGDGTYSAAIVPVQDGPHTLSSDQPFTVIAYGYDSAVSYAYPGGLNLEDVQR